MNSEQQPVFRGPFRRLGADKDGADFTIVDAAWQAVAYGAAETVAAARALATRVTRILNRRGKDGLVSYQIRLLPSEALGLEAQAIRCGVKPADIVEQFVSDLTGSRRTSGSDERDMAEQYFRRCNLASPIWEHELDRGDKNAIKPEVQARFDEAEAVDDMGYSLSRKDL